MKLIEILEQLGEPSDFIIKYRFIWEVPIAKQPRYGVVTIEEVGQVILPFGTTLAQLKVKLRELYVEFKNRLQDEKRYDLKGIYWDGTDWINP